MSKLPSSKTIGDTPTLAADSSIDWPLRHDNAVRRFLSAVERATLAFERPIQRLVREPQLNPLYHTGTIAVFALLIILVTGIYLTMFFQFGFADSYQAVAKIESNLVGRIMRALHRYASALALIAVLLHGWRTFFMDRFRGPRWLAWTTGIVLTLLVWAAGITGYWLIFDQRAQVLNQALIQTLDGSAAGVALLNRYLTTAAASTGWVFALGLLAAHLGLSAVIGLLFYVHIKRLRRPKLLPPRFWIVLLGLPLLLGALLVPVGMLPPANAGQLPARVPADLFYLFSLPGLLHLPPLLFWGGLAVITALLTAIPWLLVRAPLQPVTVDAARCTGCTLCAEDCPYRAITMVEREDDSPHQLLAVVDSKLCVSCGICVGSCPPLALTLDGKPAEPLWQETVARAAQQSKVPVRVVFTCERHASQGARPYLAEPERSYFGAANAAAQPAEAAASIQVIPLTCIGMAHPDLASQALAAGASAVQFVGCPPEDCANREGNRWVQERVERVRLPKLKREVPAAAIATDWQAPNDFSRAAATPPHQPVATAYPLQPWADGRWRSLLAPLALLAVVVVVAIMLTGVPYRPFAQDQAWVQVTMSHRAGSPIRGAVQAAAVLGPPAAPRLAVELDGHIVLDETYALRRNASSPIEILEQIQAPPGEHRLRVLLTDHAAQAEPQVLVDQMVALAPGQILRLPLEDEPLDADPIAGERLFTEASLGARTGCPICHSLRPDVRLVGPSLAGVATRAANRVPGMTAKDYLHQSIVDPNAFVVEGYPVNQMPPDFSAHLDDQQIDDLVAFLLTLR